MSRPRANRFPPYPSKPRKDGRARIRVNRREHYLGPFGSEESWREYERLLAEWRALGGARAPEPVGPQQIRDLVGLWMEHLRLKETPRAEYLHHRYAAQVLVDVCGRLPAQDFKVKQLRAVRERMVEKGWARTHINRNVVRLRTLFRWAEEQELIPEGRWHHLCSLRGLEEGEPGVKENDPVEPVPEADLAATLPELRPLQRALVDLLLLTGARPSELLPLRPCDLDRAGLVELPRGYRLALGAGIWTLQPARHKTRRKGKTRVILFGPQAQAILLPYLDGRGEKEHLFRPEEALSQWLEIRRQKSLCPRPEQQPSGEARAPGCPGGKTFRAHYAVDALHEAVQRACLRAQVSPWTPYQLRHNAATRLAAQFGLEVARCVLGHTESTMTLQYALEDLQKAAGAMGKAG